MKTLKLKKDVVSRLDREQSAMVKGGADTTVIQQTKVCALTKQCETARCVSATGCESDNCNKQILNRHFSVKLNHHLIIETTSLYY